MIQVIIPPSFMRIPYDGKQYPGARNLKILSKGANCQRFAYELLRHFGGRIANFPSSDLWNDKRYTSKVKRLRPLDLLLFNPDQSIYGAHVGLYLGGGNLIHLSKKAFLPQIITIEELQKNHRYKTFIGAKRVKPRFHCKEKAPALFREPRYPAVIRFR